MGISSTISSELRGYCEAPYANGSSNLLGVTKIAGNLFSFASRMFSGSRHLFGNWYLAIPDGTVQSVNSNSHSRTVYFGLGFVLITAPVNQLRSINISHMFALHTLFN